MARTGRFGRLPAEAQDLSSTIASMIAQYENQRDRNVEFAWNHGGKFEGQKVTDQFFLNWWQKRRNEVSDDDPMADYYDQMIFNYRFQIREQKVTLAYTQGKIKELGVAKFYVEEAGKVPRNSAIWRDLMTNAARFKKAAAKARNSGAKQSKFEQFQSQWNSLNDTYIKPAETVDDVVNQMLTSADIGSRNQWTQALGGGEMTMMEDFFSKVETDPQYAKQWKEVWEPALRRADPHHFRGHLDSDYLSAVYGRAKQGAKKQSKLAERRGYNDWKRSADNSASVWSGYQKTHSNADLATAVEQVWQDALDAGINDEGKSPDERMAIRATALKELGAIRRRAERNGANTLTGDITRDMRILRGDKAAENRSGTSTAISQDVGDIRDSEGNLPAAQGGTQGDARIAELARQDIEDNERLLKGTHVILEEVGADGTVKRSVVPRGQVATGRGTAVEIVKAHGSTYRDRDGKEVDSGSGPITIVRVGQPVRVQVGAQENVTGLETPTGANPDTQGPQSGIVAFLFTRADGTKQYQVFRDDGSYEWTDAPVGSNGSDLIRPGLVRSTRTNDRGEVIITVADDQTTGTGTVQVVGTDANGQPIYEDRPRNALTDVVRFGEERADEIAGTTPQPPDAAAARNLVSSITGLDTSQWSAEERKAFEALTPTNQRYLIDQGIVTSGRSGQQGGGGFDKMRAGEVSNERIDRARERSDAPARWFGGKSETTKTTPIPDIPQYLKDRGVTQELWTRMVQDARAGKSAEEIIDSSLNPSNRTPTSQPDQVAFGEVKRALNDERINTQSTPSQQREEPDRPAWKDPQQRIDELAEGIRKLNLQLQDPNQAQNHGMIREQLETARQEIIKTRLGSRTGRQELVAQGVQTAAGIGAFLGNFLGRNGLTDGTNKVTVEQDDTFSTYQTLVGGRDQPSRQAMAELEPIDIINGLLIADPSLARDPQRLQELNAEVLAIHRNADKDNATYTSDRLQGDGVPPEVADTATGNHPGGKSARGKGGASRGAPNAPGITDTFEDEDPNAVTDDEDVPIGPFIWGGGKGDPTQWGGLAQFSILNRRDGATPDPDADAGDRPVMKLPSLFGLTGFGNINAQEAERERLRANQEKVMGSRVTFDPSGRKPIAPIRGSRVTPEPVVRTPKPPEPEKPPPPPKPTPRPKTTPQRLPDTLLRANGQRTPTTEQEQREFQSGYTGRGGIRGWGR